MSGRVVTDESERQKLEQRLIQYSRKNIFLLNSAEFSEAAILFRTLLPDLNERAFLYFVSSPTDMTSGKPVFSGNQNQLAQVLATQFNIDNLELVGAVYQIVKDNYAKLTDFPISVPPNVVINIKGTFEIAPSDNSLVALEDFMFYELAASYLLNVPDSAVQAAGDRFDWGVFSTSDLNANIIPFSFSALVANFIRGPIELRVKGYEGSMLWEKEFATSDPALGSVDITIPLLKPEVISPDSETPPSETNKRLHGKEIEFTGNCKLHRLTVLIEAKKPSETSWQIVGVVTTDGSGSLSLSYPNGVFATARTLVCLTPDSPPEIVLRTDSASVAANETI